ncbi:putative oxidoreductase [Escherichia coli]|uniref:Putative oxidoreductase n=1 Tax=Escherichia coli TaxID=562 RepID=A0A376TSN6_ECOLX|nr:putative oxidoreductase [Escherichia coli]
MIRFAVIGTNWITRQFVEAAHESGKYKLTAVYSRSLEQAQHFANDFSVEHLFTSLEAMAESDAIDAVYIASPNALHFSQTQLFLSHKIHVICEKPLASNLAEVDAAIACARENQVVLFEAFKTACLPNFHLLRQALPKVGKLRKVFFNYCQYSSRYHVTWTVKIPTPLIRHSLTVQLWISAFTAWRRRWRYLVSRKACRQPPVCWQAV